MSQLSPPGALQSLAIQNGGVYAWGYNQYGQLGNSDNTDSDVPVAVSGLLSSNVTSIAGGGIITAWAIQNGSVYAWGYNANGQLGDGNTTNVNIPVQVDPADLTDIVSIAANADSSYALSADGSLWVWGYNGYGVLGLGTSNENYLTPQHLLAPRGFEFTSIAASNSGHDALATLAPVPEPSTFSLLVVVGGALLRRRREASAFKNEISRGRSAYTGKIPINSPLGATFRRR